ncbi:MAG TPA: hypothetical protein VMS17_32950 [Gemmataceae bacterium]|nr:hypothetical protein [Gemmataceae bacterium]
MDGSFRAAAVLSLGHAETTMGRYDRQLLIQFATGENADAEMLESARDLLAKGEAKGTPSSLVAIPARPLSRSGAPPWQAQLARELHLLTALSRLYLAGQGDWRRQTISGWDAAAAADLLAASGLPAVKTISIVADEAGRDVGAAEGAYVSEIPNSFASHLHRRLKDVHGIAVEVQARVYPVRIVAEVSAGRRGRKETCDPAQGDWANKRPHSKLRFSWIDGRQVRTWVDYGPEAQAPRE